MKKSLIAVLVLLLALALVVPAVADTTVDVYDNDKLVKSVVFKLNVKEYFVDNQVPGVKTDAAPFIENSRTYVPIRYLSNALGVTNEYIAWESPTVTLTEPGFPVVELSVGSKTIKSDDKSRQMDVSPLIRDSRTFLPARFVAEALGYEVDWDAQNQIVTCWPKGTEKPDIQAVVDHLKKQKPVEPVEPIKPQPTGKAIDATTLKSEPIPSALAKYVKPNSRIVWLTYDEFQSNVYALAGVETYGMRVTADQVYITQKGGCRSVALYEGGDIFRSRSSSGPPEARPQKWDYGYTVSLPSDIATGWGACDITNVSHILFGANTGLCLGIENPLYKGR